MEAKTLDLENEEWEKIFAHSGYYVSNKGRIRSKRNTSFGHKDSRGYRFIIFYGNGRRISKRIHRLVAIAFLGVQAGKEVNHKDGNKENNCVENLEWVTRSQNAQHAYDNNLRKAHPVLGEKNYAAKLTESKVKEIRKSLLSQKKLALKYGVSSSVIQKIKERRSWKHVM